jgi:hypothetical protein
MNPIDFYEQGRLYVPIRGKWYQFWLPKRVDVGKFITVSNTTKLYIFGKCWVETINTL